MDGLDKLWDLRIRIWALSAPQGGGKEENGRCPVGNWKSDSFLDDARVLLWAFRHRLSGKLASWTKWHHWKWFVPGLLAIHEWQTRKRRRAALMETILESSSGDFPNIFYEDYEQLPTTMPRLFAWGKLIFLGCSSPGCGKPLSPEADFPVLDLPGIPQMGFCDIKCLWTFLRDEAGKRFSGLEKW